MQTKPLLFIAGPCVIESKALCFAIAQELKAVSETLNVPVVFKASFDKANRTSKDSFRGLGIRQGLEILNSVKKTFGLRVLTDIHTPDQAAIVAKVVDIIQIPAFLSRQTDLIIAAAKTGKTINIKKAQFAAPEDMEQIIKKVLSTNNKKIMLTERGASFGYHNLVVDMRGLPLMRSLGFPVIFDATHAVQRPGMGGTVSLGDRDMVAPLARAAAGAGVDGFFLEVHPDPAKAKSDAATSFPLRQLASLVKTLIKIDAVSGARK
ncbi:MAG: 3-deoxy-8-phosphooctulonate synthase [Candidatus Raymondbacteria bacterium RifOxyA12_full_50_37]|nr:MAG: 3-deoxy-8-phosphooctulonate synthase [Candidatus Raymondbacteria bacterium RifOxyA12_full_50_37]OGJ88710.1 MAG: 3-deoxy-8-phosphooctulonate synthase [Candidatus Raymondbacteria bacterium RIFOXYA2_FULL_49_16]OGJ94486.1 MAG: 3-deoxy-8-phosphooctulonate synthase [Candidatus Raymondbacteria bacterium RifOxyC12_full_50_8]OGK00892.1 MAG: 3-deoxy-8-phosphooctulonate synthase [Candidatus Raymondbacteria bacterium RifOxyB12_full_50_8]OGP41747.1 MAG: 3-deoxy-8-phosphooctulonate synthase [Candidat